MTTQRRYIFAGIVIVACLISSAYAIRNAGADKLEVQGTGDHDLTGTNWKLQSYGETDNLQSPNTSPPKLEFKAATKKDEESKSIFEWVNSIFRKDGLLPDRDHTLTGYAGCNFIYGGFTAQGSQLEITVYVITQRGCTWTAQDGTRVTPNLPKMTYVDLLKEVQTYTQDEETLILNTPDEVLVFQRLN